VESNDLKYGPEKFEFTEWYWNGRKLMYFSWIGANCEELGELCDL